MLSGAIYLASILDAQNTGNFRQGRDLDISRAWKDFLNLMVAVARDDFQSEC